MPGWMPPPDGTFWLEIELGRPYGGIELVPGAMKVSGVIMEPGLVRIPFSGRSGAEQAARDVKIRVVGGHPVVTGEVLSDPQAIQGARPGKGDDTDAASQPDSDVEQ